MDENFEHRQHSFQVDEGSHIQGAAAISEESLGHRGEGHRRFRSRIEAVVAANGDFLNRMLYDNHGFHIFFY
jgi:hypothetical protein